MLLLDAAGNPVRVALDREQHDVLLPGHATAPHSGVFSPDGAYFLTLGDDNQAFLWETATGRRVHAFPTPRPSAGAFSPDGRRVLIGTHYGQSALWNLATETVVARFEGHRKRVKSIAFRGDGRTALTCSEDGTVIRWDVATGLQKGVYEITDFDEFTYKEKIPNLKPFPFSGAA